MPQKAKVPCREPGCPNLCDLGEVYCPEHAVLHPEAFYDRRKDWKHEGGESASKRGYGRKWQEARKAYLAKHPLCEECRRQGKLTKATVVDHIKPHKGDMKLFWDSKNWQSLCPSCHARKTFREDVSHHGQKPIYDYPWRRKN